MMAFPAGGTYLVVRASRQGFKYRTSGDSHLARRGRAATENLGINFDSGCGWQALCSLMKYAEERAGDGNIQAANAQSSDRGDISAGALLTPIQRTFARESVKIFFNKTVITSHALLLQPA